jgi:hypothetical protein
MERTRRNALIWILLTSGFSIWLGSTLGPTANKWVDFRAVYYGTRCLFEHHNPYKVSELDGVYRSVGGVRPSETAAARQSVTLYVNLPTTFIFVAPFAILPWGPALGLWMTLTAAVFILAALLIWNLGEKYAPKVFLFLICILLANCEMIFGGGNTAGIAVGLCVVAVWCFLEGRFVPAGILCLAVSLALKPHDAGLVWLYFLLAGGVYRKRALQALLLAAVVGLSAFLWVSHIAPHWTRDWQANLTAIAAPGGINEPGPASITGHYGYMVIDLQTAISVLRDDPRIYNPASYLICGALLLVWSVRTLRVRFSQANAWLALASVVPLTILVTYHRPWDAKLMLLTIPACAILWAEGGLTGWIALLTSMAGIVLTGDLPLTLLTIFTNNVRIPATGLFGQILAMVKMRPVPLVLLAMSIFYLWVYVRRDPGRIARTEHGPPGESPPAPEPA